jgi:hypothetical protein
MTRRTYATTPLLIGALLLAACPGEDPPIDGEDSTTGSESTEGPPPTTLETTVDPSTGPIDPDTGPDPDSTTGDPPPMCEPDCPEGECCIAGSCFSAPAPSCNPGCGTFEACLCPEGEDPCSCVAECVACGVEGGPAYDPCLDVACPDGSFCVVDDPADPGFAWCAQQGCGTDACACALPADAAATAAPGCGTFEGDDGSGSCFLDCGGDGAVCPTGMACRSLDDRNVCVWELVITLPGYGDCADNPLGTCQPSEDTCLTDAGGTAGGCSESGCAAPGDCPSAPDTGDAPVACGDLGGGNTCYLDCAGGQTCPDGTVCTDMGGGASACLWTEDGFVLDEDFEQGTFRPGWTVINVDGHTPDPAVEFVSDAFVVTDEFEGGTNFAAYSTSWYAPLDQADDWMITPQITLGPGSVLMWEATAPDPNYPDGYEIYVSTTGATVMDFSDPPVFAIDDEADVYTPHMVDLAAAGYANEDVYIAFRNNSDDEFILMIDNIQVLE